jgi:hypothetical protein
MARKWRFRMMRTLAQVEAASYLERMARKWRFDTRRTLTQVELIKVTYPKI